MTSPRRYPGVDSYKGQLHFGILTAREDEFLSVLERFQEVARCRAYDRENQPTYVILRHTLSEGPLKGHCYDFALIRSTRPGNSAAKTTTLALLEDLEPRWMVFIGIGGALQSMSRFDVALASEVHDLRQQHAQEGAHGFMPRSLPVQPAIERLVTDTLLDRDKIASHARAALLQAASSHRERDDAGQPPDLTDCFPTIRAAPITSSNILVDDPAMAEQIANDTWYAESTDMESIGVVEACYERGNMPCLVVRGISDEIRNRQSRSGSRRLAGVTAAAVFEGILNHVTPLDRWLHSPGQADEPDPRFDLPPADAPKSVLQAYYCYESVLLRERERGKLSRGDELRKASFEWLRDHKNEDIRAPTLRPLVIQHRHIHRQDFLPGWDLAALLLFNEITLERAQAHGPAVLRVDVVGDHPAIYDNRGKRFMAHYYYSGETAGFEDPEELKREVAEFSEEVHALQMSTGKGGQSWPLPGRPLPLRWSSGGFLPIVLIPSEDGRAHRPYFALFFRDIPPIGWNIANGASESDEERYDLQLLAAREAAEELVVLTEKPDSGRRSQKIRTRPLVSRHRTKQVLRDFKELTDTHFGERKAIDGLALFFEANDEEIFDERTAPSDVEVLFEIDAERRTERTKKVYITVNPREFGIEVTQIGSFVLRPGEVLLDGETYMNREPARHFLVRRPVALFDLDWLRTALRTPAGPYTHDFPRFDEVEAEADDPLDETYAGCGRLPVPEPGKGHFILYDYDVEKRAQLVKKWGDNADPDGRTFTNEARWLDQWQSIFAQARTFADAKAGETGVTFPEELRPICAAAWKAICLYLRHHPDNAGSRA